MYINERANFYLLYIFLKIIKDHELHIDRFIKYVTRKLLCRIYVLILILETIY